MMKKFKARYIFPANTMPIKNGTITVDGQGCILSLNDGFCKTTQENDSIQDCNGIICPGFVNTHCHLELSHLRKKISEKLRLVNFIKEVRNVRKVDEREIIDKAQEADEEMYANGIVAVGDVSNTSSTALLKHTSKIFYHNFIEVFNFVPEQANEAFTNARAIGIAFKPLPYSIIPHAAYSVSKELFKLLRKHGEAVDSLISLHNQETEEENKFYRYKKGDLVDLYKDFAIDISFFRPQARNSLQSIMPLLSNKQKILLVHNTYTNLKDIYFTKRFGHKIHWCFCPNSNLYIERTLPKVRLFMGHGFNITLGTDSLASNNKLCMLEEMRVLQEHFPTLTLHDLIQWATLNGAKFLNIDDEKGSLEKGKTPGLNLITGLDGLRITPETKVTKLI